MYAHIKKVYVQLYAHIKKVNIGFIRGHHGIFHQVPLPRPLEHHIMSHPMIMVIPQYQYEILYEFYHCYIICTCTFIQCGWTVALVPDQKW